MFDVASFALSDMVECAAGLRRAAEAARTMNDAGQSIVTYLRQRFVDIQTQEPTFLLARMYVTKRWGELDVDLQDAARKQLPDDLDPSPDLLCMVLAASDGDRPE